jgi:hypothetical protein
VAPNGGFAAQESSGMKLFPLITLALYPYLYPVLPAPIRSPALKTSCSPTREGKDIAIVTAVFTPEGEQSSFKLSFDGKKFAQYFLSVREFKCVEGVEVLRPVPYPYANPQTVSARDCVSSTNSRATTARKCRTV